MNKIIIIAKNTFSQLIKDNLAYAIVFILLLTLSASMLAGTISLKQEIRIVNSFTSTALLLTMLIICFTFSAQILEKEKRERQLFFVLTRPISKWQYYLGKWAGIVLIQLLTFVLFLVIYLISLKINGGNLTYFAFIALAYIFIEGVLLSAIAMLLSVWTKQILALTTLIMLFFIGHSSSLILTIGESQNNLIASLLKIFYYVMPNLEKFNLRNDMNYLSSYSSNELYSVLIYFVSYLSLVLIIGARIFKKKDVV